MRYTWPGNVRKLENVIERGLLLSRKPLLGIDESISSSADLPQARLKEIERRHILTDSYTDRLAYRRSRWSGRALEDPSRHIAQPDEAVVNEVTY